jgi:hypothetical protein
MGFHNHDLVWYLLPAPLPQEGAYAFFARLTSDVYAPSDPFLVVINNGVEYHQMLSAALAINAEAAGLPGDYNGDQKVDAGDYVAWRNRLGEPAEEAIFYNGNGLDGVDLADYAWWKQHYGDMSEESGGFPPAVPEPPTVLLATTAFFGLLLLTSARIVGIVTTLKRSPFTEYRGSTTNRHLVL